MEEDHAHFLFDLCVAHKPQRFTANSTGNTFSVRSPFMNTWTFLVVTTPEIEVIPKVTAPPPPSLLLPLSGRGIEVNLHLFLSFPLPRLLVLAPEAARSPPFVSSLCPHIFFRGQPHDLVSFHTHLAPF